MSRKLRMSARNSSSDIVSAWQKTRLFREICPPGSMNAGDFHSELDIVLVKHFQKKNTDT
jgi:hypothetical protein